MVPRLVLQLVLLLLVIFEGRCNGLDVGASRLGDIYWNVSNPIFRIDNTDHIIDVNRGNKQFEYDQVNIICPSYPKGTAPEDAESYIIYNVSKEEYDSCSITTEHPRTIAVCDKPEQLMYFTITFRSFTPQPGGLEFHPGQDYFFITTSTGSADHRGLFRRRGGRCSSHHMKVIFKVARTDDSPVDTPEGNPPGDAEEKKMSSSAAAASSTTIRPSLILSNSINNSILSSDSTRRREPSVAPEVHPPRPPSSSSSFTPHQRGNFSGSSSSWPTSRRHDTPQAPPRAAEGHFRNPWSTGNSGSSTERPRLSSPSSTPYWWRPHFTKLPPLKTGSGDGGGGGGGSAGDESAAGSVDSSSGGEEGEDPPGPKKSGAWIIVVGAGVAVTVACLLVTALYTCTQFLFFPPRRRKSGSGHGGGHDGHGEFGTQGVVVGGSGHCVLGQTVVGQTPPEALYIK